MHQYSAKMWLNLVKISSKYHLSYKNQSLVVKFAMHHSKTECTAFGHFTSPVAPKAYNPG
jgi:hypothetical protein